MFPTGSRLLIGATALATTVAVIYGSTVWGSLGTTGLIFLACGFALLAGIVLYTRDGDVSVKDPAAETAPAARPAPQPSIWPLVAAVGAVLVVVGLITYPVVFVFGLIALLAATVEWMVAAWSERASADREFNVGIRERMANPAEFPVLATLAAAVVIYSFSRIMLFLSKTGGPVAFGLLAALVLAAGFVVAFKPQVRAAAVSGVAAIAVLGLVAGGVAAALAGEREIEAHETTGSLAAEGHCATDEHTHADDNASQTVGAKANLTATVTLHDDGTLRAKPTGIEDPVSTLFVQRSNPTNIVFRNETDHERRLVLDLGVEAAAADETGATVPDETQPVQLCTSLAEEGGAQFLTFEIGKPADADHPYRLFVPGVDGAEIEVVVP